MDPQKYADPRIRIQEGKISTKTANIFLLLKPKSELLKKEIIQISSFLNGSSSFRIIIGEKNYFLLKTFSKSYGSKALPGNNLELLVLAKIKLFKENR